MIEVDRENTALLITDPRNDFLSPEGATWGLVGENVTVENIEHLRELLEQGFEVMVDRAGSGAWRDMWRAVPPMAAAAWLFRALRLSARVECR